MTVEEYCQDATVHGVSKIHNAKRVHTRVFWITVFTLFISSFSYLLYVRIEEYSSYNIKVATTHEDNQGSMLFPSITLCNANRISLKTFTKLLHQHTDYKGEQISCDKVESLASKIPEKEMYDLSNVDNFFILNTYFFNNIVYSCGQDFLKTPTITKGTCFTFNFDGKKSQTKPGSKYGLKFAVDIDENDYFPCDFAFSYNAAGLYISIHHPMSPPDLNRFILASPGKVTRIGLSKTYIKRLEYPYKDNCRLKKDASKDEYHIITSSAYNVQQCHTTCFIMKMNETCGGIDIESSLSIEDSFKGSFAVFPSSHSCIQKYMHNFHNGSINCKCRPLCEEIEYHHVINTGKWPPTVALEGWENIVSHNKNRTVNKTYIKDNMVAVEIFYNDFRTIKTIHSGEYSYGTLVADMGGLSGLFLGASFFSLVEFVVFLGATSIYFIFQTDKEKHSSSKIFAKSSESVYK